MQFYILFLIVICSWFLSSCTTIPVAERVRLVSQSGEVHRGHAVGPIRGEHCAWKLAGFYLSKPPSLDLAIANASEFSQPDLLDHFFAKKQQEKGELQYINNLTTEWSGFNALVIGKSCLVVKGVGYR